MLPAFRSARDAIAFAVFVAFVLALPVLLSLIGLPPRRELWRVITQRVGPTEYAAAAAFDEAGDPDIVFVGSSTLLVSVMPEDLERALTARLRRPVRVRVLGFAAEKPDGEYILLRDYLERHRPKLVVIEEPFYIFPSEPWQAMYSWVRYGDFADKFAALPRDKQLKLYAEEVVGAPRTLVSMLRPNLVYSDSTSDYEKTPFMQDRRRLGWLGASFAAQPADAIPPPRPAVVQSFGVLLEKRGSRPVTRFAWKNTPYGGYFLRAIDQLIKARGSSLLWMHIPTTYELGWDYVPISPDTADVLGLGAKMLSNTSEGVFPNVDESTLRRYYYSEDHMNVNGALRYSPSLVPALAQALDQDTSAVRPVAEGVSEHGAGNKA